MDPDLIPIAFVASLAVSMALDLLLPLRALAGRRRFRWLNNGLLFLIDGVISRLAVPGGLVAVAYWAGEAHLGLLAWLPAPSWLGPVAGVLLLDLAVYAYHRAAHRIPLLWRLHRTHHTDVDVDATTTLRQHPLDSLCLLGAMASVVVLAGLPPEAVMVHALLLFPVSLFSHGNWLLPAGVDRWLRWLVITPAMHRIHHSAWQPETDSNFGGVFSWWDRLFGSYRQAPRDGYVAMRLGLSDFRGEDQQILHRLLLNPVERAPRDV